MLDVATGTGLVLRALAFLGLPARLIGVDISAGMLEVARAALPEGRFLAAEARRLPVAGGSADLVSCVDRVARAAAPAGFSVTRSATGLYSGQGCLLTELRSNFGASSPGPGSA